MVLIVTDRLDNTTSRVIEYLNHYNIKYIRFNKDDHFEIIDGIISDKKINFQFRLNNVFFKLSDLSFYWYRRGGLKQSTKTSISYLDFIKNDLEEENNMYEDFLNQLLIDTIPSIGDLTKNKLNKLLVLSRAASLGINIPETTVTTLKSKFLKKRVISKGVFFTTRITYKEKSYSGGTIEIKEDVKNILPDNIPLTSVQERLEKDFEIRSFYLKGNFYNMVILSQSNPKTVEDFRNYDRIKPNRTAPCKLPLELEKKLHELYLSFGIDSCSTDLVKSLNNKYVLLDINPVGQFGMVSGPCNYYLEKLIATYIKNEYEKFNKKSNC